MTGSSENAAVPCAHKRQQEARACTLTKAGQFPMVVVSCADCGTVLRSTEGAP